MKCNDESVSLQPPTELRGGRVQLGLRLALLRRLAPRRRQVHVGCELFFKRNWDTRHHVSGAKSRCSRTECSATPQNNRRCRFQLTQITNFTGPGGMQGLVGTAALKPFSQIDKLPAAQINNLPAALSKFDTPSRGTRSREIK